MSNGSEEIGYLTQKKGKLLYFDFVDDTLKICSKEMILLECIEKIEFICDSLPDLDYKKMKLITLYGNEKCIGNIIYSDENYILFNKYEEFSKRKYLNIILKREVKKIVNYDLRKNYQFVDINKYVKKFNYNLDRLFEIAMSENLLISVDNKNYNSKKIGVIHKIEKRKLKIKLINQKGDFYSIFIVKYEEIEIFQIYNIIVTISD